MFQIKDTDLDHILFIQGTKFGTIIRFWWNP